jgi:hypothetical protein
MAQPWEENEAFHYFHSDDDYLLYSIVIQNQINRENLLTLGIVD